MSISAPTQTQTEIEAIQAELARLSELEAELRAEQSTILDEIARNLESDIEALETRQNGVTVRLQSILRRRAHLEAQQQQTRRAVALAQMEALRKQTYAHGEELYKLDTEIAHARDILAQLEARRQHVQSQSTLIRNRVSNMVRADSLLTQADAHAIAARYQFTAPTSPNYEQVMRARAARGDLPPGKTLADFGIKE